MQYRQILFKQDMDMPLEFLHFVNHFYMYMSTEYILIP